MSLSFSEFFCQKISRRWAINAEGIALVFFLTPLVGLASVPEGGKMSVQASVLVESEAYRVASRLMDEKKWEEAAIFFQSLLKQEPKSIPYLVGLATAWIHMGKRPEAIEALLECFKRLKGPQKKWLAQKIRVFSRVFLTSKTFQIYQDGLNALALGNYVVAREKFERALAEESDNVEILVRLGQTLVLANSGELAFKHLRYAQKICPLEPQAGLWLARALHLKGSFQEAYTEFGVLWPELKDLEYAPLWLGETLTQLGQPVSALRLLENDARIHPSHLASVVMGARLKLQFGATDKKSIAGVLRSLQHSLKKLDEYYQTDNFDSANLGLSMKRPRTEVLNELQNLILKTKDQLSRTTAAQR